MNRRKLTIRLGVLIGSMLATIAMTGCGGGGEGRSESPVIVDPPPAKPAASVLPPQQESLETAIQRLGYATAAARASARDATILPRHLVVKAILDSGFAKPDVVKLNAAFAQVRLVHSAHEARSAASTYAAMMVSMQALNAELPAAMPQNSGKVLAAAMRRLHAGIDPTDDSPTEAQWREIAGQVEHQAAVSAAAACNADTATAQWCDAILAPSVGVSVAAEIVASCPTGSGADCDVLHKRPLSAADIDRAVSTEQAAVKAAVQTCTEGATGCDGKAAESKPVVAGRRAENTLNTLADLGLRLTLIDDNRAQQLREGGAAAKNLAQGAFALHDAATRLRKFDFGSVRWVSVRDYLYGDRAGKKVGAEELVTIVTSGIDAVGLIQTGIKLATKLLGRGGGRAKAEAAALAEMQKQQLASNQHAFERLDQRLDAVFMELSRGFDALANQSLANAAAIDQARVGIGQALSLMATMNNELKAGFTGISRQQLNLIGGRVRAVSSEEFAEELGLLDAYLTNTVTDTPLAGPRAISAQAALAFAGDGITHANALAGFLPHLGLPPLTGVRLASAEEIEYAVVRFLLPMLERDAHAPHLVAHRSLVLDAMERLRSTRIQPLLAMATNAGLEDRLPNAYMSRLRLSYQASATAIAQAQQRFLQTAAPGGGDLRSVDVMGSPSQRPVGYVPVSLRAGILSPCAGTSGPSLPLTAAEAMSLLPDSPAVLADAMRFAELKACYALPETRNGWLYFDWARIRDGVAWQFGRTSFTLRFTLGDQVISERTVGLPGSWNSSQLGACVAVGHKDNVVAISNTYTFQSTLPSWWIRDWVGPAECTQWAAEAAIKPLVMAAPESRTWEAAGKQQMADAVAANLASLARVGAATVIAEASAGGDLQIALREVDALLVGLRGYLGLTPALARSDIAVAMLDGPDDQALPNSTAILAAYRIAATGAGQPGEAPGFEALARQRTDALEAAWLAHLKKLGSGQVIDRLEGLLAIDVRIQAVMEAVR